MGGGRGPQDRPAGTCRSGSTGATLASMNTAVGSQDWCVRFWMGDIVILSAGRIWRRGIVSLDGVAGSAGRVGLDGFACAVGLALFFTIIEVSPAMSNEIIVGMDRYDEIFVDVQTSCNTQQSREISKTRSIDNLPIVFDGTIGAIAKIGTNHGIGPLKSGNKSVGLIVSYDVGHDRCDTFLFLKKPLKWSSVKTFSAFPSGHFASASTQPERSAFKELLKRCVGMGGNASSEFTDGGYILVDGDVVNMEGGFDCNSSATRNSSATKFTLGTISVRISIFGGKIFVIGG